MLNLLITVELYSIPSMAEIKFWTDKTIKKYFKERIAENMVVGQSEHLMLFREKREDNNEP